MKTLKMFLVLAQALFFAMLLVSATAADEDLASPEMTVYKSPSCGCCKKWIAHLEHNHFATNAIDSQSMAELKTELGIKPKYRSCHTGVVDNTAGKYVFEGHVPAEYVSQFLSNPPEGAIGLSVPGMPVGSPGMEVGERKDYYRVLQLNEDGTSSIFAHVNQ